MVASLYSGHGKVDVSAHKGPAAEGVSNCYVFKSRLQEYAQKAGLTTPVYETSKEGPSHEPYFKSTVIVDEARYDSLPGFSNRKAAEQSAAEVALLALAKSGEVNECVSQPVHETGLCKNLLQEYAQKMNYAIPLYICKKKEASGRAANFTCTVEIGGISYIGTAATTKKEAEIKAARTALLAIQASSASGVSEYNAGDCPLTVVPSRKRTSEVAGNAQDAAKAPKAKKGRFKKRISKRKQLRVNRKCCQEKIDDSLAVATVDIARPEFSQIEAADVVPVPDCGLPAGEEIKSSCNGKQAIEPCEIEIHSQEPAAATLMNSDCQLLDGEEIKSSSNGKQATEPCETEIHSEEPAAANGKCQVPAGKEIKSSSNGKQVMEPCEREMHSQQPAAATPMNGDLEHVEIRSSNGTSNIDATVPVTLQVSDDINASVGQTDVGNMLQIVNDAALNQVEMAD